ncbi:FHA domain-containing protein [Magnetococcales bacterium HHB-1]
MGKKKKLSLRFNDKEIKLSPNRPAVTMGRDDKNDIVINDKKVSRLQHSRCDLRGNYAVLVDWSTNGTYVTKENGKEIFLHKDALFLVGDGKISLGRKPSKNPDVINYSIQ